MLNYNINTAGLPIGFQQYLLPVTALSAGSNTFTFGSNSIFTVGENLYAQKIDQGFNCCPLQFMIFNNNTSDLNSCFFGNGGQDFNSTVDFLNRAWTILFPLDKTKGNHTHIDFLNNYLELRFASGVPTGDVNIYVLFTYFK
jgi:hypothetical protein